MRSKLVLGPALAGTCLVMLALLAGAGTFSRGGATAAAATAAGPTNTARPTVTGTARENQTLTASTGSWTGSGTIAYTYQWQRCDATGSTCANIVGATTNKYVLQTVDVGKTVAVAVTATDTTGSATVYSSPVGPIAPAGAVPAYTTQPTISGNPLVGETLTVSNGTWSGTTPIAFSYQWQRCDANAKNCDLISGATTQSYTVTSADVGHTILVGVTATNSAGAQVGFTAPTAVVTAPLAPGAAIDVSKVSLPDRLVISKATFTPRVLMPGLQPFNATFHVVDTNGHPVTGALVYAVALPYGRIDTPPETPTDASGNATLTFTPLRKLAPRAHVVFFVRARKQGEDVLAGVSTRRLVQVLTGR
jgi:uncharacterized protein YukE